MEAGKEEKFHLDLSEVYKKIANAVLLSAEKIVGCKDISIKFVNKHDFLYYDEELR